MFSLEYTVQFVKSIWKKTLWKKLVINNSDLLLPVNNQF